MRSSVDTDGHDFKFIPFGEGRRICPAKNVGMATMELALANLLYSFDWDLPEGMKKEDIGMDEAPGITVHRKSPLMGVKEALDAVITSEHCCNANNCVFKSPYSTGEDGRAILFGD
ncbi:cytochrome P450 [Musa troglodytarum]|uniref:Cytochrome P450 n=1 Tax=Musa troglodytarum TaxID=320322 RepID=A0A9E7KFK9_9LILI|nr:cytochrome P450 [Musa troglodytarum]